MWDNLEPGKIFKRAVRDKNQKIVAKAFLIESFLAEGDDWKVLAVVDQQTMKKGTLKIISKTQNLPKERKQQIFNQIQNQKKMSGRHSFVDLEDVFEDCSNIYLVMQKWGIPLQQILQRRHTLMEREVQLIFCELVDILQQLRSSNISHGNINLSSLLLAQKSINQLQLTNFSNSEDLSKTKNVSSKSSFKVFASEREQLGLAQKNIESQNEDSDSCRIKYGNMEINEYTSPEQLFCQDRQFSKRCLVQRDIWSCGVLLFKLLTGTYPFSNEQGKLAPNKIKSSTFSFPKLDNMFLKFDNFEDTVFKNKFNHDYLSVQWKELLKRMLSNKQQRITIQQLINHPFRQQFMDLKLISDLKTSLPSLTNLYSKQQHQKANVYNKAWNANFQQQNQSEQDQQICFNTKSSVYKRSAIRLNSSKAPVRQSRQNSILQAPKDHNNSRNSKLFRVHKTHFPVLAEQQNCDIQRRQAVMNTVKQRNNLIQEDTIFVSNSKSEDPGDQTNFYVAKEPTFLVKFKYFKKEQCLGYILNNSVGVAYKDGTIKVGHQKQKVPQAILAFQSQPINKQNRLLKQSRLSKAQFTFNQGKFNTNQLSYSQQILQLAKKPLRIDKNEDLQEKFIQNRGKRGIIQTSDSMQRLPLNQQKLEQLQKNQTSKLDNHQQQSKKIIVTEKNRIFNKVMDFLGEREVRRSLDLWVQQFWRDGNVYIFLLNNGCWQVAFLQRKRFRIYAVDQNQFIWSQNKADSPQFSYVVRSIIHKYKELAKKKLQQSKNRN